MQRIGHSLAIALVVLGVAALVRAGEPEKAKPTPESVARLFFQGDGAGDRTLAADQALGLGREGMLRLLDLVRKQGPVYEALAGKRISLEVEDLTLAGVAALVAEQTGLKLEVSPGVQTARCAALRLTLHMDEVPACTVLALMTRPYDLAWEPRGGSVWIGPAEELAGR